MQSKYTEFAYFIIIIIDFMCSLSFIYKSFIGFVFFLLYIWPMQQAISRTESDTSTSFLKKFALLYLDKCNILRPSQGLWGTGE